jgi:hypothetical protein
MPAVQTNYPDAAPVAYEGMIQNTEPNTLISRTVAVAAIGFGLAVKQATADHEVEAADAAADVYRGITVRDQSIVPGSVDEYPVEESATIMTKGVVWVTAGAAVAAGAAVYMIAADGRFTDVSTSNLAIPNAVFDRSTAAADELVPVRLN